MRMWDEEEKSSGRWNGSEGKRDEKKRGTKRISEGTRRKEGTGGWMGPEVKKDQEDCQGFQQKRGTRRIEGA